MNILKPRRTLRRLGLVAALAVAFGVGSAAPALAHPHLVGSTPGKGASANSVTEVKLVFSDEISLAEVIVKDDAGRTFQSGDAGRSGTTVTQKLSGTLPAGSYTVAYRVVGEDGHPIENDDLTFTATAPSGGAPAAEAQPLKADQGPAAAVEDDSSSNMVLWALIVTGLLIGIGIGVGIVYRAKRQHQAATGRE